MIKTALSIIKPLVGAEKLDRLADIRYVCWKMSGPNTFVTLISIRQHIFALISVRAHILTLIPVPEDMFTRTPIRDQKKQNSAQLFALDRPTMNSARPVQLNLWCVRENMFSSLLVTTRSLRKRILKPIISFKHYKQSCSPLSAEL